MRTAARAALLVVATAVLFPSPAAPQSTTAPQAAPSMPPGETPPEAARDPKGPNGPAASGMAEPAEPAPRSDPSGGKAR